jgi:Tol biopolymer transport system component
MKKKFIFFISLFVTICLGLVMTGLTFDKTENEKQNGLSTHFDVSVQDTIAYVTYDDGEPSLHLYNQDKDIDATAFQLEKEYMILDPTFSHDGATLAFIAVSKNLETNLSSTVYLLDLRTKDVSKLFSDDAAITELAFDSKDRSLFYLRGATFENYSPIASKRPHNFDIYRYDFPTKEQIQLTNLQQYSMSSLHVSADGTSVYVQMDDDRHVESPEDTFNVKQRVFQIPLDNPDARAVISDPKREVDIFDFTFMPNGKEMIFQSISNADANDTFQYELYSYDLETKTEKQLTYQGAYAAHPVVSADGTTVYFMATNDFTKRNPHYRLYKLNVSDNEITEISLPKANE